MAATVKAVQTAGSATLTANTVDTITVKSYSNQLRIINRSATAADEIWITVGSTKTPPADPTVAGDNCFCVKTGAAGITLRWPGTALGPDAGNGAVVKLISSAAAPYTIQGADFQ